MECVEDIRAPIPLIAVRLIGRRALNIPPGMSTQKRKIGDVRYNSQLTPFRESSTRYKRSRSAGAYARTRRSSAYGRRNIRAEGYLGIEKKFYDTSFLNVVPGVTANASGAEADPAAPINCISSPAQGDGESNRDGKKITAKYITIKGSVVLANQINQTALSTPVEVKIAVVLDTQTNGAQLNSEDVFKNSANVVTALPQVQRDLEYGSRFKILKEENFMLDPKVAAWDGTNIEVGGARASFDWYIPLKNLTINFNSGTTAVIANVVDNSIHVIAYQSQTVPAVELYYNSRMRFVG